MPFEIKRIAFISRCYQANCSGEMPPTFLNSLDEIVLVRRG
jgi:hypothetical protein